MFAFGSNSRGQLGVGDTLNRYYPDSVRIPPDVKIVQIAAGSYHSVFLAQDGRVFSCGAFEVKLLISFIYYYVRCLICFVGLSQWEFVYHILQSIIENLDDFLSPSIHSATPSPHNSSFDCSNKN